MPRTLLVLAANRFDVPVGLPIRSRFLSPEIKGAVYATISVQPNDLKCAADPQKPNSLSLKIISKKILIKWTSSAKL